MQLDAGSVGRFAHPHVQILPLPRLEEEDVVAVVQVRNLVQMVQLRLGVQLCVFAPVGEHCDYVFEEMAVAALVVNTRSRKLSRGGKPVCYAAGGQHENPLLVLFGPIVAFGGFGGGFGDGFVDRCHCECFAGGRCGEKM